MKRTAALSLCYLAVAFSIFILLGSFVPPFGKLFLAAAPPPGVSYGDLYALSELSAFKIPIPLVDSAQTSTLETADVWALGDSFFDSSYETPNIPVQLADALHVRVFHEPGLVVDPIAYLKSNGYKKGKPKLLILETVERAVIDRGLSYGSGEYVAESTGRQFVGSTSHIQISIFDAARVDYFFKHNIIVNPLRVFLKRLNFNLFGRIDPFIGAYSAHPPMLFYKDEVDFDHFMQIPFTQVTHNIETLSRDLRESYNIQLVYVVIPNKYTIYYDYTPYGDYNGFLDALQPELENNEVISSPVYAVFREYRKQLGAQLLYFPNDTHLTGTGKQIVTNLLVEQIKPILSAMRITK